jgi:deoxyribodipyrimidine photolyase-like uncharacterized protein
MRAALIYPHQLFADHPALRDAETCVLVEEPLLMTQYRFHRQKLILHRTSMQHFAGQLRRQKQRVHYVECGELDSTGDIAGVLKQLGVTHAQFVDPSDDWLQQRLTAARRVLRYAYCHHIERLMILGNFMLLCEIDPTSIYQWFMELLIDAYDWVMVPNVFGMSQHADGGLIATKPYVSGSSYVLKMSDFRKGPWCEIWDALY